MAARGRSTAPDHRASEGARHVTFSSTCGALEFSRQAAPKDRVESKSLNNPMKRSVYLSLNLAAIWLVFILSLFANSGYAAPAEIASRMDNVYGVQINYLAAAHGRPV